MAPSSLTERTREILRQDEPKFIEALEIYYSRFPDKDGPTFNAAARMAGVNPAYLVNYIFYCNAYIGMPETSEDAVEYFNNLQEYKRRKKL